MRFNKRGWLKTTFIVLGVIILGIGSLFYFFGLPLPMPTLFDWGSIQYKCIPLECPELKEENACNMTVTCLWTENTCKENMCASYTTQTSCKNALLGRKCSWIKDKCQESSCRNYKTEDSCNLEHGTFSDMDCIWVVNYCKERECSSFEAEGSCQNAPTELDCKWVDSDKRCSEKMCYDYINKETCEEKSFCKWENGGIDYEGCSFKSCEDHVEESNCLRAPGGCTWYNHQCVDDNCGGSLYANEKNCEGLYLEQGCTWDKKTEECQSPKESCNYYKNKTVCGILPLCLWSEEMKACIAKITKECRRYKYDYAACINETDDLECTWTDNPMDYQKSDRCISKTCSNYNKKEPCLNTPKNWNCRWIEGNRCRPIGGYLCRELKSLQCNDYPLCKWQVHVSSPSSGLKMF